MKTIARKITKDGGKRRVAEEMMVTVAEETEMTVAAAMTDAEVIAVEGANHVEVMISANENDPSLLRTYRTGQRHERVGGERRKTWI